MKHHKYLIVGGGMTADSAVHGIRKIDQDGAIAMICEERHLPYDRPPLTKSLWKGAPFESIWRNAHGLNVAMHLGKKVVAIDPSKKTATDDAGNVYTYEKLLLATGGMVRRFPDFDEASFISGLWTTIGELRELSDRGSDFVVIGGGFIGSEIAAALAMNDKRVTMIFPENAIGARVYPRALAEFLNSYYREKGVDCARIRNRQVCTDYGRQINCDDRKWQGNIRRRGCGRAGNFAQCRTGRTGRACGGQWRLSWMSFCARATPTFMRQAMSPISIAQYWVNACASSMRTTPIPWAKWRDANMAGQIGRLSSPALLLFRSVRSRL